MWRRGVLSIPDLEEAVPGARAHGGAVLGHAQAADAVVVARKHTCNMVKPQVSQGILLTSKQSPNQVIHLTRHSPSHFRLQRGIVQVK